MPPDTCPTCGQAWPHDGTDHDDLADELTDLYGPSFEPPTGEDPST